MKDAAPKASCEEKLKTIDELLNQDYALVHINTKNTSLILPEYLLAQGTVTLKLSRFFKKPVYLEKIGINAELLFNGEYTKCFVPWETVWGVTPVEGDGKVWPDAIPSDVIDGILAPKGQAKAEPVPPATRGKIKSKVSHLKRIK